MALDYKIIGERIRKSRLSKKMTQEELAEKIDVSVAFISRIERGNIHLNLTRLNEICEVLDIDEGTILNGTSSNSKNYLASEFNELLNSCTEEHQKMIYDIAKIIKNSQDKNKNNIF